MAKGTSNLTVAEENYNKLKSYLDSVEFIPSRRKRKDSDELEANVTLVCENAGIDRQVIYGGRCRKLWEEVLADKGLAPIDERGVDGGTAQTDAQRELVESLRDKINDLTRKNITLKAEVEELQKKLAIYKHMEASGRAIR